MEVSADALVVGGASPTVTGATQVGWTNSFAHALCEESQFKIGGRFYFYFLLFVYFFFHFFHFFHFFTNLTICFCFYLFLGVEMDKIYSEWFEIYSNFYIPGAQQQSYNEMVKYTFFLTLKS
jgi:hypothetical protein